MSDLDVVRERIESLTAKVDEYHSDVKTLVLDYNKFKFKTIGDLSGLKVKSGIWGLIGAAIPTTIAIIYFLLTKK